MQVHNDWMRFAEDDLRAAKVILKSDDIVIGAILFHSQQCAEKSLKAYLAYTQTASSKTHDLSKLVALCASLDPEFLILLPHALNLNPYMAGSRYPDAYPVLFDVSEAEFALKDATYIFEFVKNKLN